MRRSPRPDAPPMGTASSRPKSVTYTDKDSMPHDNELPAIQPPPRKRQKTENGGGKVCSAANLHAPVSALLELPLDVLLEILTHVDPMSLRHVSRTSRALRDTLTGPRSNWIWRASYANTDHGLPPAPEDITVPQFLGLLVDRVCDSCHASPDPDDRMNRIERIWTARTKYCSNCLYQTGKMIGVEDMTTFPMVREIHDYFGRWYPLSKIFPFSYLVHHHGVWFAQRPYPRVLVQRVVNEFSCDTDGKSKEDKKAWIARRAETCESVEQHATLCHIWEAQEMHKQRQREIMVRNERLEAIVQRLKDLDVDVDEPQECKKKCEELLITPPLNQYIKEMIPKYFPGSMHSTRAERLVLKARQLVEEDWPTIRKRLLQATENRRQILEDRYSAFKQAYHQFKNLKSRGERRMLPSICTLAKWDEVVNLIEGTPLERELSAEEISACIDKLAQARFSEWQAAFEAELIAKLNAADTEREHPATTADLELATSAFSYKSGSNSYGPLWYPDLLGWSPLALRTYSPEPSYHVVRKCPPWSAHEVHFDGWRWRLAARTVSMAGLDPATATCADMASQRVWFVRAEDKEMVQAGQRVYLLHWDRAMLGAEEGDEFPHQPGDMLCCH
ncbi:hypothetical protein GGF50DRAFT_131398 [Schizophyllum commune]